MKLAHILSLPVAGALALGFIACKQRGAGSDAALADEQTAGSPSLPLVEFATCKNPAAESPFELTFFITPTSGTGTKNHAVYFTDAHGVRHIYVNPVVTQSDDTTKVSLQAPTSMPEPGTLTWSFTEDEGSLGFGEHSIPLTCKNKLF